MAVRAGRQHPSQAFRTRPAAQRRSSSSPRPHPRHRTPCLPMTERDQPRPSPNGGSSADFTVDTGTASDGGSGESTTGNELGSFTDDDSPPAAHRNGRQPHRHKSQHDDARDHNHASNVRIVSSPVRGRGGRPRQAPLHPCRRITRSPVLPSRPKNDRYETCTLRGHRPHNQRKSDDADESRRNSQLDRSTTRARGAHAPPARRATLVVPLIVGAELATCVAASPGHADA